MMGAAGFTSRRDLDFYSTPSECTEALVDFLNLPPCHIYEPACGEGFISKVLEQRGHRVTSTDIRETGFGTGGIDFLTASKIDCDAIITNPPFFLSVAFIEKALSETKVVAMLLKSQYWHSAKRFSLFNKHKPSYILPLTWRPDFYHKKGAPTMEILWTVWNGSEYCQYIPLRRPAKKETQLNLL